jgi:hypothetical protein
MCDPEKNKKIKPFLYFFVNIYILFENKINILQNCLLLKNNVHFFLRKQKKESYFNFFYTI